MAAARLSSDKTKFDKPTHRFRARRTVRLLLAPVVDALHEFRRCPHLQLRVLNASSGTAARGFFCHGLFYVLTFISYVYTLKIRTKQGGPNGRAPQNPRKPDPG